MARSTRFAVAVHILTALAAADGEPTRSESLAYSATTNAAVIRGLLTRLHDAGLTTSRLGAGGGSLLARPSRNISLLDVYRAVEDTELMAFHREAPSPDCPIGAHIQDATRPAMQQAQQAFEDELEKTSIADIAESVSRLGGFALPLRR